MIVSSKTKTVLEFPSYRQSIPVIFSYDVHFTRGLFNLDNPLFAQTLNTDKPILIVADAGFLSHHPQLLEQIKIYGKYYELQICDKTTLIPGGEIAKNDPQYLEEIHQAIDFYGLCRHSYIVAIGGGAVLDMVGYAAATAHRGIRLIRIPTTVLAQNDSGVGVKNGINYFNKKNFLGTFNPPYAVLNDFNFLVTLSERDWRSGIAEAIKVALLKDKKFFQAIVKATPDLLKRDLESMAAIIYLCAQLHLQHIGNYGDPFERGSSRPLDFGHWAAHKLEQLTDYQLRHGEAVAIGIALDTIYSSLAGFLSEKEAEKILTMLKNLGFELYVPQLNQSALFSGLKEFQEHIGGQLTLMLLREIGKGIEVNSVDLSLYQKAIAKLGNFAT